jgi:hypothetical protein
MMKHGCAMADVILMPTTVARTLAWREPYLQSAMAEQTELFFLLKP